MNLSTSWRKSQFVKVVFALICVVTIMSCESRASLGPPKLSVPVILEEAADVFGSGWLYDGQQWSYVEDGELRSSDQQVLLQELARKGWREIRVDPNTYSIDLWNIQPDSGTWADLATIDPIMTSLVIRGELGPWQLAVYITEGESYDGFVRKDIYCYRAMVTHVPRLEAPISQVLPSDYQMMPRSQLLGAYVLDGSYEIRSIYRFSAMSPIEAIVAHHDRLPNWKIYSLGILGAFGYGYLDDELFILYVPSRVSDVEETFYIVVGVDMEFDIADIGGW